MACSESDGLSAESEAGSAGSQPRKQTTAKQTLVIVLMLLVWTYLYNRLIKGQGPVRAFFQILDTISDDFVMGSLVTISVGVAIVCVFSITKLYAQIVSNTHSFKILEDLFYNDLKNGNVREYLYKVLTFRDQPRPLKVCPERVGSLLFSFSFICLMSWVYLVLFSEALFFVSWSAGVDLPINEHNLLMMPTLALAIPFSARVMAYLKYPYASDYADFMPGAVFVLLLVATLGYLFQSDDQKFFLLQVWENREYLIAFLKNGIFLAFIPVFFEALYWLMELNGKHVDEEAEDDPCLKE